MLSFKEKLKMSAEPHYLEDLIDRLALVHDENSGVGANMLTVALGDVLNQRSSRIDERVSFSSVKREVKRGHFSDWYIVIFVKLSEEGLCAKRFNAYGQSEDHLSDDMFIESPQWRSDGVDETVRYLRGKSEFAAAKAQVEAALIKLEVGETVLAPSRPSRRI